MPAHSLEQIANRHHTRHFQAQEKARKLHPPRTQSRGRRGFSAAGPIIVYLSALGVPADGKVYLIPGGGRPDDFFPERGCRSMKSLLASPPGHRSTPVDSRCGTRHRPSMPALVTKRT